MSDLIASQISVTTGDIAKAAVGAAKQRLATAINVLDNEYKALNTKLSEEISELVLQKVEESKNSAAYADLLKCAKIFTKLDKNCDYGVSVYVNDRDSTSDTFVTRVFAEWFYNCFMTGKADHKMSIRKNRKNELDVSLVIYFINKEESDFIETLNSFSVSAIDLTSILQTNEDNIKRMVETWNKSIDFSNKLKGHLDPVTNMTLEEEITNAITMQAVSNMPEIASVFDTTALVGSIINGYLE